MENIKWNMGSHPDKNGEYHVIFEAKEDIAEFKAGDLEVTNDYYSIGHGWDTVDDDNPSWRAVAWAEPPKPNVPVEMENRVVRYFGICYERENPCDHCMSGSYRGCDSCGHNK